MLRVYRAYLLLGLLTSSTIGCGEADDLLDGEDTQRSADDDGALSEEDALDDVPGRDDPGRDDDGDDDAPATGSVSDGGVRADAGAPGGGASQDAGPLDAGRPDAGRDAGAPRTDGGSPPSASICPETDGWDAQAAAFEEQVLALTNAARAAGHNCDTRGSFGATGPLAMQNQLRCAARLHSKYMATTGEFAHTQATTGKDPGARIVEAGYRARTWGENIAWGQRTPQEVVNGWLESDGHCANIMNPAFKEIGVGYALGSRTGRQAPYWTQNFGASR